MRNFLVLCVHHIPLLMLFNIELLRKRKKFQGGGGGGGGGGKLVFGEGINWFLGLGEIPGLPR